MKYEDTKISRRLSVLDRVSSLSPFKMIKRSSQVSLVSSDSAPTSPELNRHRSTKVKRLRVQGRQRHGIDAKHLCGVCGRNLTSETLVKLECGDNAHKRCFEAVFSGDDHHASCNLCGGRIKQFENQQTVEGALSPTFSSDFPTTPTEMTALDSMASPLQRSVPNLLTPNGSQREYYELEFDDFLRPRVTINKDVDKITVGGDGNNEVNCVLSVKAPMVYAYAQESPEDSEVKRQIKNEIARILPRDVSNWSSNVDAGCGPDELLMFDYLEVSTNGSEWDVVTCFFFEKMIALVKGEKMIGKVEMKDVASINTIENGFIMNLKSLSVPEILVREANDIIKWKWATVVERVLHKNHSVDIPLKQITYNAFNLLKETAIPLHLQEFADSVVRGHRLLAREMAQTVPSREPMPVNLAVSVSMINRTSDTNAAYVANVARVLNGVRSSLRPIDKLGVVLTGVDGTGRPCWGGSYTGFVEASWDGWDTIINSLEVSDDPVFADNFEELQLSLEKALVLFSFALGGRSLNKLMIVHSNTFNNEGLFCNPGMLTGVLREIVPRVSTTFVSVGRLHSFDALVMRRESSKIVREGPEGPELSLSYGNATVRFDSFADLITELPAVVRAAQAVCVPQVEVSLASSARAQIAEIEVNGRMERTSEYAKITIAVKDVYPLGERAILMKLRLNMPSLDLSHAMFEEVPLIKYRYHWDHDSRENTLAVNIDTSDGYASPVSEDEVSGAEDVSGLLGGSLGLPMLLTPAGETLFARRQMETLIIESLSMAMNSAPLEGSGIVLRCISLIFGMVRSGDSGAFAPFQVPHAKFSRFGGDNVFKNNREYGEVLTEELDNIRYNFTHDQTLAYTLSHDLINLIV